MTDTHLMQQLRLTTSSTKPDIDRIVKNNQYQILHQYLYQYDLISIIFDIFITDRTKTPVNRMTFISHYNVKCSAISNNPAVIKALNSSIGQNTNILQDLCKGGKLY